MIAVLVNTITSRVEYAFEFIFGARSIDYALMDDFNRFEETSGIRLNYSKHKLDCPSIRPSNLLSSTDIFTGKIDKFKDYIEYLEFDSVPDLVASVFYVLSRMEEYTASERDEHGRFPFKSSILYKFNWIEKAVCDRWAVYLLIEILNVDVEKPKIRLIPTFDIDNTFAYKLKTGKRKILSTLKDVSKFDSNRLKERRQVERGGKDPYDTFDQIKLVAEQHPETKLFWLTKSDGIKDRNLPLANKGHQEIIREMSKRVEVNIHPSYDSFGNTSIIKEEVQSLEVITEKSIISSRQHFLRFELPGTFHNLLAAGIKHDYSMGFAASVGFRAGTSRSHFWFDLTSNTKTDLRLHPFVYMDGTLLEYNNYSIEKAKKKIEELYAEVTLFGGDFIFLWHNETIGDYGKWKGWSEVLNYTLNLNNE